MTSVMSCLVSHVSPRTAAPHDINDMPDITTSFDVMPVTCANTPG